MKRIIIGITSRGNDINHRLARWLFDMAKDKSNDYQVILMQCPLSAQVGEEALLKSLEDIDFDYAFITDTDVSCENETIGKLLEVDKDIVVGPVWHYDGYTEDIHLNIHKTGMENLGMKSRIYYPKKEGVEKIISSSFACLLLSKKVFSIFKEKGLSYVTDNTKRHGDNIFFQTVHNLGIDVWVRWDIQTRHTRLVDLSTEVVEKLVPKVLYGKHGE